MSIQQHDLFPGYPILAIRHPAANARIALHGAHLMEWTPAGHEPVLYLSPDAVYQEGKAIRGGVPVCWPWFGPHPRETALPAHGLARSRFWKLASSGEDDTGVRLTFLLTDDPATRRLWDHAFRLELEMSIGAELQLALRMLNTGGAAFTVSGALHSYLAVGGIGQIHLTGLENAAYLDTVGSPQVRRQDGPLVIDREVDRNYRHAAPVAVHDAGLHRTLTITGSGSQCTVVWNPWIDKAKTLTDLPDPAYQNFICVETANAWEDLITLAPGESHTLATTVRVR